MAVPSPSQALADQPHHDGSPRYRESGTPSLGDRIVVRLRVPHAARADRVRMRSTPDAEPMVVAASVDREDAGATWWVAELRIENPVTRYRFLLTGGLAGYLWVNEAGTFPYEVADDGDFQVTTFDPPPAWLDGAIGYQIFIDRFAASGAHHAAPDWAIPQRWDDPVDPEPGRSTRQWYGGDLLGIEQRLGHLERLGVNLIYLTPFFPARSSHRYDASSFDHVDPLLGGDEALASLSTAAHARGMRLIGDITLNHTGAGHDWFRAAVADSGAPEADYYMFSDHPVGYVAWHDVPSLPKLDHRSQGLQRRLYDGSESVIARYLDPPFALDGWRVDCANTTGRRRAVDVNHDVATTTRRTTVDHRHDGWLLAEHCYDVGDDLAGDGWHGAMAYQWFSRPVWSWLRGERAFHLMSQLELPPLPGGAAAASMRRLGANASWTARNASMTMLDSHDSARFRTVVEGSSRRHGVGVAALFTMPGVPTVFAGSEVGVEGDTDNAARRPFPWDERVWDQSLLAHTQRMIELRATRPALQRGSMRWIAADDDSMTYVRESDDDAVLVRLARSATSDLTVDLSALGLEGAATPAVGTANVGDDGRLHLSGDDAVTIVDVA